MINIDPKILDFEAGKIAYDRAIEIFPYPRSITGNGLRQTLSYFKKIIPQIQLHEVPSGTQAFDWTVPPEWNWTEAYIQNSRGEKILDAAVHNLHLMGYSTPIDAKMSLKELSSHLFSLHDQPEAIPYITSYYKENWGFCLTHRQRLDLPEDDYRVVIRSELKPGNMTYAELFIPGESSEEIFFSSYACHPSMANNELSGPLTAIALMEHLLVRKNRYSYRFFIGAETIGSITYLSRHLDHLKKNMKAGFVLTCVGDNRTVSYLASRTGETLADKAARCALNELAPGYQSYSYLERGSDERQYCSPRVDLPVCSVMRSKYHTYKEYHTSLDDMSLISAEGFAGTIGLYKKIIELLEFNDRFLVNVYGEPQLGKRGLYPQVSTKDTKDQVRLISDAIAWCDGKHDVMDLAKVTGHQVFDLIPVLKRLVQENLISPLKS